MAKRPRFENLQGTSRDIALEVLYLCMAEDFFAHKALTQACERRKPEARARAAATEMAFGAIRMKMALDWAIEKASGRSAEKIDPATLQILRLAEYQFQHMANDAPYAIVNSAVNQARKLTNPGAAGFVNAVLRRLSDLSFDRAFPDREQEPMNWLSITHSHPEWIVSDWVGRFGFEIAIKMCEYGNTVPKACIRVNRLKLGRETLMGMLMSEGRQCQPGALSASAVVLGGWSDAASGPLFDDGLYSLQDESSMLVAETLGISPGMVMIDMCSAPGGKACHAAELSDDMARIVAADVNPARLALISQNARRLGIKSIEPLLADASGLHTSHASTADRIIADVPCSGMGVLSRRPDSRWRKNPNDIATFSKTGSSILDSAATCLKPGGLIAFSTCTVSEEENERQVERFLIRHPEFRPYPISALEHKGISKAGSGMAQLLGGVHGSDGFFIALLEKRHF